MLCLRCPDDQTFEFLSYLDLAAQAAVGLPGAERGVEHFILVLLDRLQPGQERFVDVLADTPDCNREEGGEACAGGYDAALMVWVAMAYTSSTRIPIVAPMRAKE